MGDRGSEVYLASPAVVAASAVAGRIVHPREVTRVNGPVDVARPFRGRVFRYGDHVNTDVIFPGRYTYTKSRPEEVAPHALEDLDPTFVERVRPGDVIVGGLELGLRFEPRAGGGLPALRGE